MANKAKRAATVRLSAARKLALANVAPAAFNSGIACAALANAIRAAGGNKEDVCREAIVGRIAARLPSNKTQAERIAAAYIIIGKPGLKSDKKDRRTQAEHDVWNAAKVWLSGFLKREGIVSTGKNAGNKNAAKRAPKSGQGAIKEAPKPPIEAAPRVRTRENGDAFVAQQAAMLLSFHDKNVAILSLDVRGAIVSFHKALEDARVRVAIHNQDGAAVKRVRNSRKVPA